ncbi:MAG: NTP transferase domain-containing protein [Truepera sp.]|nr:NTP transferase domain-containing protein [Truepera sp.]
MDYLCLAAGPGTRFGRLGCYLQKCMYPIGLKPFLAYTIDNLKHSLPLGTSAQLVIVIGHYGEQVKAYFGEGDSRLKIAYLEQGAPQGTGQALKLAWDAYRPTDPVIVWLADLYVPPELFAAVRAHQAPNVVTHSSGLLGESDQLRASLSGERVTRVWQGDGDLFDIGLWKLQPQVLAAMTEVKAGGEYRALPNLQRCIERGAQVGWVKAGEWLHLGGTQPTPEQNVLAVARRVLALEGLA